MNVSLLVPTRNNINGLAILLETLYANASNNFDWEILFAYDRDDINTKQFLEQVVSIKNNVRIFEFEHKGYPRLHEYFNFLCEKTNSKWLWSLADDIEIICKNWNDLFQERDFKLLHTIIGNDHNPMPLCPAIPKKWHDIVGHFSQNSQSDCWIGHIGNNLKIIKKTPCPFININRAANGGQHQSVHFYSTCVPQWQEDLKKIANYLNITEYNLEKDPFS